MSTSESAVSPAFARLLRRLYLVRFVFAVAWAALLWTTATTPGPLLTTLLVVYPLFDAAAVLWQLRADHSHGATTSQRLNVAVSVLVAVALGWASTVSLAAALVVWGVWAVGAGVPQLITAIRNRQTGGQVPQMLSGGISVLAGLAFLTQGLRGADDIGMVGDYATVGGVFFLISAVRLSLLLRKPAS
jgi:uncharacterized membrane protein HdeD (DUF308 family)